MQSSSTDSEGDFKAKSDSAALFQDSASIFPLNNNSHSGNSTCEVDSTATQTRWANSRRQSASSLGRRNASFGVVNGELGSVLNDVELNDAYGYRDANRRKQQQQQPTFQCPAVVPLNVGGVSYITRRSTLLKDSESMLAAMFSGRHEMQRDRHGYYFIDTNGAYFGFILDYLRHGKLPPNEAALPVYQEAGYFGLAGLQEALSVSPAVAKQIVRQRHEEQFADYAGLRARVIATAIELGVTTRCADLLIWPHRVQASPQHTSCVAETAHIKFGPWSGQADEDTLMRTLHADLTDSGYNLAQLEKKRCKFFVSGQTCTRQAYKLTFRFA